MAIPLETTTNATIASEAYAAGIHIRANPVTGEAGSITLEMVKLVYHNGALAWTTPAPPLGETVGEFAVRSFTLAGGNVISGMEVIEVIKQYVEVRHAESIAPPPAEPETPAP